MQRKKEIFKNRFQDQNAEKIFKNRLQDLKCRRTSEREKGDKDTRLIERMQDFSRMQDWMVKKGW
jgi:hypothetical protein